jgi:hypothetical protein
MAVEEFGVSQMLSGGDEDLNGTYGQVRRSFEIVKPK